MGHFGTDGIRGRSGEGPLAPEGVVRWGLAVGRLARERGGGSVLLGRDPRPSGPSIRDGLVRGLHAAGVRVGDAGILTTPGIAWLVAHGPWDLGIVVSASHNPASDNGIKVLGADGGKLTAEEEARIESLWEEASSDADPEPAAVESVGPGAYLDALAVRWGEGFGDGRTVVLDCANGAAAATAPEAFRRAGFEVVTVACDIDAGDRINEGCGALHPEGMAARVRASGAWIGFAFDGDGDRVLFADGTGTVRDGDDVLLLLSGAGTGDTVVGTVMTNGGLEEALRMAGIRMVRTPVGDRHVSEAIAREGACVGGEPSGHVILPDWGPTGDGLAVALAVCAARIAADRPLDGLWTRRPQVHRKVSVARRVPFESLDSWTEALGEVERELAGTGRVVARNSGTELIARIMVEAADEATAIRCAARLEEVLARCLASASA